VFTQVVRRVFSGDVPFNRSSNVFSNTKFYKNWFIFEAVTTKYKLARFFYGPPCTLLMFRSPPRPSPAGVNYNSDDEQKSSPGSSSSLSDKASDVSSIRSQVTLL
jgi:hypothetical protein